MKNKKAQELSTLFFVLFVILIMLVIFSGMWISYRNGLSNQVTSTSNYNVSNFKPALNITQVNGFPLYPNHDLTPGDVLTDDDSVVCVSGYTGGVRNVPESERKAIFALYHVSYPPVSGAYELDHFIPLELGGSNEPGNLWPEAADPIPGFHEKDLVENYLHKQVCAHNISLRDAQVMITNDWVAVYRQCCIKE